MQFAFLWHIHQPDYRDPHTAVPRLPFVRHHAVRGVYDLLSEGLEHPMCQTLNFSPIWLEQLLALTDSLEDPFFEHFCLPASELDAFEQEFVKKRLAVGHENMTLSSYYQHLRKRAPNEALSTQELLDLQVWSELSWFSEGAIRQFPLLKALKEQEHTFCEQDKQLLIAAQRALIHQIPQLLRRWAQAPHLSLCLSPYSHGILPLIINTASAKRQLPGVADIGLRRPEYAKRMLDEAQRFVREELQISVEGLWPSEGSVSPELIELASPSFRWFASDRKLIAASGATDVGCGPYKVGSLLGFFRDTDLSDRIGFRYAQMPAKEAVADLVSGAKQRKGLVFIALDGENPWESYADGGAEFRKELRLALTDQTVLLDHLTQPVASIPHLCTGSWINCDFRIWYGHPVDRQAWSLLKEVDELVNGCEEAWPHLRSAFGSDWFWWYGPEFETPFEDDFDGLFRDHLRRACELASVPPPSRLGYSLRDMVYEKPAFQFSNPCWSASLERWSDAGVSLFADSSMAHELAINRVYYCRTRDGNQQPRQLWLRIEGRGLQALQTSLLSEIVGDGEVVVVLLDQAGGALSVELSLGERTYEVVMRYC